MSRPPVSAGNPARRTGVLPPQAPCPRECLSRNSRVVRVLPCPHCKRKKVRSEEAKERRSEGRRRPAAERAALLSYNKSIHAPTIEREGCGSGSTRDC